MKVVNVVSEHHLSFICHTLQHQESPVVLHGIHLWGECEACKEDKEQGRELPPVAPV